MATTVLAIFGLGVSNFVSAKSNNSTTKLKKINHIVVIYQENHSFDNLYGGWEGVNGLNNALAFANHHPQIDRQGVPFTCLLQNDVNLTSPIPIPPSCNDTTTTAFSSAFQNAPFSIDKYIAASDKTCPPANITKPDGILKNSAGALLAISNQ